MKLNVIYFTTQGQQLGKKIAESFPHEITLFQGFGEGKTSLSQFVQEGFAEAEGLIFISATGIAVRGIAPFIQSKMKDPAVLVLDDGGNFVISLLSGHFGQANALTLELSTFLGNTPVITTSTDNHRVFAIDSYAKKEGFSIIHPECIKIVSGKLLRGETVSVFSQFPVKKLGKNMQLTTQRELAQVVISDTASEMLSLIPKNYMVGMGCKKGVLYEELKEFAEKQLDLVGISLNQICGLCSIDLKKEEQGLVQLAKSWAVPFHAYSAEELQKQQGEFSSSTFVSEKVGVDNVCERSVFASGCSELIVKKLSFQGMTFALGKKEVLIDMKEG